MVVPAKAGTPFAFLLLFPAAALAAPTWLECTGIDERFADRTKKQHTLRVMFDEANWSVQIMDGQLTLHAARVDITPVKIYGNASFQGVIDIDRNSGAFTYMRFNDKRMNTSAMKGQCTRAAVQPKPKF